MKQVSQLAVAMLLALLVSACGSGNAAGGGGATPVAGHALVVQSAAPAARFGLEKIAALSSLLDFTPRVPGSRPVPSAGRWDLTPDSAKVTLVSLGLLDATGNAADSITLTSCTPTYTSGAAAGTQLLDCPFTANAGTYYGVNVGISTASQVLFNDSTHGFISSASGMTSSGTGVLLDFTPVGPGGGNVFTVGGPFGGQTFVYGTATGASTSIFINTDFVHTVFANVTTGGAITLDTSLPIPPVSLLPSVGAAAKEQFYTSTGTAANVYECGSTGTDCTNDDNNSIRVTFPPGSLQPNYLFGPQYGQVLPVDPATSPTYPDGCKRGGYLGYDATKQVICWADPANCLFTSYTQLCQMTVTSTPGQTATITCQAMTSVPAPASGAATYASGCPPIVATTGFPTTVTLVDQ